MERDKKILKLAVFGVQVAALLIESFSTWLGGGKNWVPDKEVLGSALRFEIFTFAPLCFWLVFSTPHDLRKPRGGHFKSAVLPDGGMVS